MKQVPVWVKKFLPLAGSSFSAKLRQVLWKDVWKIRTYFDRAWKNPQFTRRCLPVDVHDFFLHLHHPSALTIRDPGLGCIASMVERVSFHQG
jgi:hypothetical protein